MPIKRGAYFDGIAAYLDVIPAVNLCGKILTVCFDFIPEKPRGIWGYLYSERGNPTSPNPLLSFIIGNTSLLRINFRDNNENLLSNDFGIQFGNEYRLCMRYDGTKLKLNLNNDYAEVAGVLGDVTITYPAYIGQQSYYAGSFYRGLVKWGVFYDRALNDDEAMQIILEGRFPILGLAALYDFERGHAIDLSTNGNHGIPHNIHYVGVFPQSGMWLDGGGYVEVTNGAPTNRLAAGMDFKPAILSGERGLIGVWDVNEPAKQSWVLTLSGDTVRFAIKHLNGDISSVEAPIDDTDHRIVVIFDLDRQRMELWDNGILLASTVPPMSPIAQTDQPLQIGSYGTGTGYTGLIKTAWVRRAIPRDMPRAFVAWGANADAFWDFTTGQLRDLSGHGHDLTPHGDVKFIGI